MSTELPRNDVAGRNTVVGTDDIPEQDKAEGVEEPAQRTDHSGHNIEAGEMAEEKLEAKLEAMPQEKREEMLASRFLLVSLCWQVCWPAC